jgi:hypothetical protein
MSREQLEDLLRYRLEQAHEALREAGILLGKAALGKRAGDPEHPARAARDGGGWA